MNCNRKNLDHSRGKLSSIDLLRNVESIRASLGGYITVLLSDTAGAEVVTYIRPHLEVNREVKYNHHKLPVRATGAKKTKTTELQALSPLAAWR